MSLYHIRLVEKVRRHEHNHGYCTNAYISVFLVRAIEISIDRRRDGTQKIPTIVTFLTFCRQQNTKDVNAADKLLKIKPTIDMV